MKSILMQHELTAELEKRSGVSGLKIVRLKGYTPSWELGGMREKSLDDGAEAKLQRAVHEMQQAFDIA